MAVPHRLPIGRAHDLAFSPTTRKGDYSEAYIRRHPGAPSSVQWQAGVVVKKGSAVDTNVWSSRANW